MKSLKADVSSVSPSSERLEESVGCVCVYMEKMEQIVVLVRFSIRYYQERRPQLLFIYKMHYEHTRLHPLWNLRLEANTQGILLLSVSSSTFLNYETANVPLWCRNIHISHCLLLLLCTLHYGGSFIQILIARMVEDCLSSFSFIDMWSSIGLFAFSDME